jgi:rod shape determining protein RodA
MILSIQKKIQKIPIVLVISIFLTCCFGFLILYSASGGKLEPWCYKQILNFSIFFPVAIIIALIDIRLIFKFAYIPYIVTLILLIAVMLFGVKVMGAQRWIDLGIIRIQPSEISKISLVLALSKYFHNLSYHEIGSIKNVLFATVVGLIPIGLIIKQPDLGTGVIGLIIMCSIFFVAGVRIWKFLLASISCMISTPIIWYMLHDYQKKRIMIFLDPESDPLNSGYNIIQSKIAIGSGGFWGKGFNKGTQSHLDFLPEHQTDFIFASMAEEFGFFGGIILIIFYSAIILCCACVVVNAKSKFAKLLTLGICSIFFSHGFINIAMVMGILPVVGVPLPLISYGGTMIASMLIGFGLVMNAEVHQNVNLE